MIRGLYSAATGMLAQQSVQDVLASNLANINTTGFKQDRSTFQALHEMALNRYRAASAPPSPGWAAAAGVPVGAMGMGVEVARPVTDLSAGSLAATNNPLDLAIEGDGFFAVQTAAGERFTRAGDFHLQPAGNGSSLLVDAGGNRVLGLKGPIDAGTAHEVHVEANGDVLGDGKVIDRLKLLSFPVASLTKQGGSLFSASSAGMPSAAAVRPGFLEQANVNAVSAMVQMITVQRAYEAAQKAITSQDETLNKAINEVPRV